MRGWLLTTQQRSYQTLLASLRSFISKKSLLLTIIYRQPLHEKGGKSRSGATTERVEDEEALKTSALIGGFADAIEDDVDELFADGVVTTGVVVCSVLFA